MKNRKEYYKEYNMRPEVVEAKKKYVSNNLEFVRQSKRDWKKRNPEKVRANKREYQSRRRAQSRQAVPIWYDSKEVRAIYLLAQENKLIIDHLVPLNSEKVCGLHVQDNLRCIPEYLNLKKGNRYWPDMWDDTSY